MELKQNVGTKVPVRLRAVVDGSPLTGVTYLQATVYIQKYGGASISKPLGPSDWIEVDAVNMPGEYDLVLQAGDLDTLGFFKYAVAQIGISMTYPGLMQVVANIESDIFALLGAPVGASISADLQSAVTSIKGAGNKDLSQVDTDVTSGTAAVQATLVTIDSMLARTLALSYDNVVEDSQTYDGNSKLTGARVRFYDSAAHAITNDGVTGLLYQYLLAATYDGGGNCTSFRLTRNP